MAELKLTIWSGGQSGVDLAALEAAEAIGLAVDGWIPRSRKCEVAPGCEDGKTPARFALRESTSGNYKKRTERNVADSDGTLILHDLETLSPGTKLTIGYTSKHDKPCLVIDLRLNPCDPGYVGVEEVRNWLSQHQISKLNIAGPRHTRSPGIRDRARIRLEAILRAL